MFNDMEILSSSVRNWWYNLHLDDQMVWIAILMAIAVAVLVTKILRPPKT